MDIRNKTFAALTTVISAVALATSAGGAELKTTLAGADAGGSGSATVSVDTDKSEVCYTLTVAGLSTPATMAHIHKAPAGSNGPVAVPLASPANGSAEGCASVAKDVAEAIVASPGDYYVNVHTSAFRGGAVRGQLSE